MKNELVEIKKRWNERAVDWDVNLQDPKHYSNFEKSYYRTDRFTEKFLKKYSNKKILENAIDLGCGTGESTRKLVSYSRSVFGIDIADEMIKIAKKKKINAMFSVRNVLKTKFNDNFFDIVISRGIVISHIPLGMQLDFLKEIKRISKTESLIIFDYLHDVKTKVKYTKYSSPKANFDKFSLLSLLNEAGLNGQCFFGGRKTERVNRVAIFR